MMVQSATPVLEPAELLGTISSDELHPLPYSAYPTARDVAHHGVQALPPSLPLVDFGRAQPHRSSRYSTVVAADLTRSQVLQMARVVAASFARREPQSRHLRPPKHPPAGLMEARHSDPFGSDPFGPWNKETLLYWFIRLFLLTNPTSSQNAIQLNEEALAQSLAIVDQKGQVIGGAFNETMPPDDAAPRCNTGVARRRPLYRRRSRVRGAGSHPAGRQDAEALTALSARYPEFLEAYAQGKVGHHALVARSDALAKADDFELVAASAEHYRALGYAFMVAEATNQWTGAAFEVLGGVRVHFYPFQAQATVLKSVEPLEGVVTSASGFLSDKDSGGMFYVIRLA